MLPPARFLERIPVGVLELAMPGSDERVQAALNVDAVWYADASGAGCPGLCFRPARARRFDRAAVETAFRAWRESRAVPTVERLVDADARSQRFLSTAAISGQVELASRRLNGLGDQGSIERLWKSRPWLLPAFLQENDQDPSDSAADALLDRYWSARSLPPDLGVQFRSSSGPARESTQERGQQLVQQMLGWDSFAALPHDELVEFATAVFGSDRDQRSLSKVRSASAARLREEFGEFGLVVRDLSFRRPSPIPPDLKILSDGEAEHERLRNLVQYMSLFPHNELVTWIRSTRFTRFLDLSSRLQRGSWSFFPVFDDWDRFMKRRLGPFHRVSRFVSYGRYQAAECSAFLDRPDLEFMLSGSVLDGQDRVVEDADGSVEVVEHAPSWQCLP